VGAEEGFQVGIDQEFFVVIDTAADSGFELGDGERFVATAVGFDSDREGPLESRVAKVTQEDPAGWGEEFLGTLQDADQVVR
jgi:hypothetical protein